MKRTIAWTPRAAREAERANAWWTKNRPLVPDLLERELAEVIELVRSAPTMGAMHEPGVRRLVLSRTRYLLFYSLDSDPGRIYLLGLWSALRGRAPRLRSPR